MSWWFGVGHIGLPSIIMPRELPNRRTLIIRAVALVMAAVATATVRVRLYVEENMTRGPYESEYETRRTFVTRVTNAENHCIVLLRMDVRCFRSFVSIFRNTVLLEDTIHCCVEEQVAIFLQVIAHSQRNRTIRASIRRSGATVSKYFNKDCIGAIDGTHIQATVAEDLKPRFICRKGWPSQNVLAVCDFDLKFTYVLAGWEGSASDSRVLAFALSKPNGIPCLPGKFYLADGGYPCLRNFITPIRGIGYHLNDIRGRRPQTADELYNQRHSSARNVIERTFGVLKKRFNIINTPPMYPFERQVDIVLACCCVHNHIRREMPNDTYIPIVDNELGITVVEEEDEEEEDRFLTRAEDVRAGDIMESTSVERRKKNNSWNDDMDRHLIVAIQHQIAEGQKAPNGFKNAAYSGAAQELTTVLQKQISKDHVKNRLKTMKTNYRFLNTIVNLSGFGWDPQLKKISVEEQRIAVGTSRPSASSSDRGPQKNDYLARNPEHLRFFNNRWELYEEMKVVFGEDYATGEFARDRHAPSQDTQDVEGLFSSSQAIGLDDMFDGTTPAFTPPPAPRASRSRHSSPVRDTSMGFSDSSPLKTPASGSKGKRKRRTSGGQLSSDMTYLLDSVRMVAEAIITTGEVHSLAELKAAVMSTSGFTMLELLRAYTYLHKNHKDAEVFLSLSKEERVAVMGDIVARLA
ncbi:uncharacterized protein LOC143850067 [Tasmannia lanceolata]|uniref:uncharacterized protein LOC143850067 n=1 Tax=Tasmannia lanceolata TaxID=3420 RepID=UPI004064446C